MRQIQRSHSCKVSSPELHWKRVQMIAPKAQGLDCVGQRLQVEVDQSEGRIVWDVGSGFDVGPLISDPGRRWKHKNVLKLTS